MEDSIAMFDYQRVRNHFRFQHTDGRRRFEEEFMLAPDTRLSNGYGPHHTDAFLQISVESPCTHESLLFLGNSTHYVLFIWLIDI